MADLSIKINAIIMAALRDGVPIATTIAALERQSEMLRLAAPIVSAVQESGRCST